MRKRLSSWLLALLLTGGVVVGTGVWLLDAASAEEQAGAPASRDVELVSLRQSLNPLKEQFNRSSNKARVLVLLSPT